MPNPHHTTPGSPFESALAAQEPFLRRLARALISDEHAAEDAVQETLLSAWKSAHSAGTDDDGSRPSESLAKLPSPRLRAWLATVLKRKSFSRLRSNAARRERVGIQAAFLSSSIARPDEPDLRVGADQAGRSQSEEAPDQIALRLERQMLLQEATLGLSAIYRESVVLRFQDAMSAAEIAAQLNLPVATVRSRIQRGLELLRSELDRRNTESGHADARNAWFAAIAPLAIPPRTFPSAPAAAETASSGTTAATGGLVKSGAIALFSALAMKQALFATAAVLAAAGAVYFGAGDSAPAIEPDAPRAESITHTEPDLAPLAPLPPPQVAVRAPLDDPNHLSSAPSVAPAESPAPTAAMGEASTITGRALLMDGTPLARILITARESDDPKSPTITKTRTVEDGGFTLDFHGRSDTDSVTIFVSEERYLPEGAMRRDVPLGSNGVDMRLDAIDVRILPPAGYRSESPSKGGAFLRAERIGGDPSNKPFLIYRYESSKEAASHRLLQAGPSYLFKVSHGEFGDEELTVIVPEGLSSGRYEFELATSQPDMASYQVNLTGEELEADSKQTVSVFLSRKRGPMGAEASRELHGQVSIGPGESRTQTRDACLPGESKVFVRLRDRGQLGWCFATCETKSLTLSVGATPSLDIDIQRGGRLLVNVSGPDSEGETSGESRSESTPARGMLSYRYPGDAAAGEAARWHIFQPLVRNDQGAWELVAFVEPGRSFASDEALPVGTIEVRLACEGFEEARATLEVLPGQFTDWNVDLVKTSKSSVR